MQCTGHDAVTVLRNSQKKKRMATFKIEMGFQLLLLLTLLLIINNNY